MRSGQCLIFYYRTSDRHTAGGRLILPLHGNIFPGKRHPASYIGDLMGAGLIKSSVCRYVKSAALHCYNGVYPFTHTVFYWINADLVLSIYAPVDRGGFKSYAAVKHTAFDGARQTNADGSPRGIDF